MKDPVALLSVARGDAPADLLLTDARYFDVFSGRLTRANIAIVGDRIAGVGDYTAGLQTVSLGGACVAPGLIDAHVHIESSMLPPHEFGSAVLCRGTTCVIADPHEIANVHGLEGIRYMLASAACAPLRIRFALSSCVPATDLETSGATLSAAQLAPMFDDERIVALAEMMNYPGVVGGDPAVMEKLRLGATKRIDGHAPGLRGRPLQAYVSAGISSDHECTTAEEAREKLALGMQILIREGTAAQNLEALLPAIEPHTAHRFAFCTDDRHPDDLTREGHIDHVIRKAIRLGLDPVRAVQVATLFPARHYGLMDQGAIAPGCLADLIVVDSPDAFGVQRVMCGGRWVFENGEYIGPAPHDIPTPPRGGVRLPDGFSSASFRIAAPPTGCRMRVIGLTDAQLLTKQLIEAPTVRNGECVASPERDVLKLAVLERHRGSGRIGLGFVRGFGLARGALAGTVAHDSHNLLVLGTNDADMCVAATAVANARGGLAVAEGGRVTALLPLPIAGLMSDQPRDRVVAVQDSLRDAAAALGSRLRDPFMPLSFLSLPVIPSLKLTDRGLVDVERFELVGLFVE